MSHMKMDRGWLLEESELALKLSSMGVKELAVLRLKMKRNRDSTPSLRIRFHTNQSHAT